jgi:iron complex outermembrane receptor protein
MIGDLTLMGRANIYGSYENSNPVGGVLTVQEYDPVVQFDLEGRYRFNEIFTLALGGRNIFDEYPQKDKIGDYCCGALYPTGTPVSWDGSYYYARLSADF